MTVVLSLTLASAAHALTVEIVLPSTDSTLIAVDRPQAFEAVAYDDQQQDATSEVTWSWDFGDGSAADTDNPTEHVFETAGDYTVTVTGAWSAQQQEDDAQVGVDAQEPTGAFVLARQLPGGAYESLQGTEVCHHRYLIVLAGYEAVQFKCKYPWDAEFRDGMLLESMEQITLDGQQRLAWVLLWPTSECPGQAEAGIFNGPMTWQIVGHYTIAEHNPPEMEQLIGEPTYTVNNTVVSSSTGVLLFDPEDEELDSCEISWTTTHQNAFSVQFAVPIHIYDLAGNELYTYTKTGVPLGNDSWVWDGTITPQEPEGPDKATKGIYTHRLGVVGESGTCGGVRCACTGEPSCARGDWDKSAFLEISDVDTHIWDVDLAEEKVTFSVWYYLNQAASGVGVRVYDPQLQSVFAYAGLPSNAGTHHSLQYEFPIEPASFGGHYSFVLDASETGETAESNRDRAVNWAQQMGTTEFIAPIVEAKCRRHEIVEDWSDWRPAAVKQQIDFYGFEHGFGGMTIIKREWNNGYGDWVEGQEAGCHYTTPGDKTAVYRVTYVDDLGCQRTVEDTCDLTVFSLACGDMWFLDVETPPEGYPDETTFVATGATTGQFHWEVVGGEDKVEFENHTSSMTKTDNNSVGVHATGFSATVDDVEIAFSYHRPQDEELVLVGSSALTVFTAHISDQYQQEPDETLASGYRTFYVYKVTALPGGSVLPAPLPVNESFGDDGSIWEGENWPRPDPKDGVLTHVDPNNPYWPTHHIFRDWYTAQGGYLIDPAPLQPIDDRAGEEVFWRVQQYRSGSLTPGQGILLRAPHTVVMHRGYARHQ